MGAFLLINQNSNLNLPAVFDLFNKKGFKKEPVEKKLGNYKLYYYPKILVNNQHILEKNEEILVGVGTFIINNKYGSDALDEIYKDIKNNCFNISIVKGDFLFIHYCNNNIYFYPSPSYTYNVYYNREETIFSSSFLAVITGLKDELKLNREAATEVLLTGNLIGPDTLVSNILRLENSSTFKYSEIKLLKLTNEYVESTIHNNFSDAVEYQIETLSTYFDNCSKFISEYGINVGLTGGLDSRLFLGNLLKQNISPKIYSTWRKEITNEFRNAQKVAESVNLELSFLKHKALLELTEDNAKELIEENLIFNDGMIRTYQLWTEEIKSRDYLTKLTNGSQINSSGVGGEQYRNSERIRVNKTLSFNKWLKFEVLFKNNDKPVNNKSGENLLTEYLRNKVNNLLNINISKKIDYFTIKRYNNEVYNPANRTIRNNIENQLYYFLSPFTDYTLSRKAYSAIPWLGIDFAFENAMITQIFPAFGSVETDYGFKPMDNINLLIRCQSYMKSALPQFAYWYIYRKMKKNGSYLENLKNKFCFVNQSYKIVEDFNLPVDLNNLFCNDFLAPLILELGYLMGKYNLK